MKYKLIASDFDGTIYDAEAPFIPPENQKAIEEYIAAGGIFILATGRMYQSIKPYAKQLNLHDEIIAYQGASIYNLANDELLFHNPMSTDDTIPILKYIEASGYHCQIYYNDIYYINTPNAYSIKYCNYCGIPMTLTNMPLSDYIRVNNINPTKIMVILPSEDLMGVFNQKIERDFGEKFGFARSGGTFLEIINIKANKGIALKHLAEKYNIRREEIVAIGDSTNDISMIKYAGMGIAVANAMDELKEVADYIGDYAANNAVAKIIQMIIKEQL